MTTENGQEAGNGNDDAVNTAIDAATHSADAPGAKQPEAGQGADAAGEGGSGQENLTSDQSAPIPLDDQPPPAGADASLPTADDEAELAAAAAEATADILSADELDGAGQEAPDSAALDELDELDDVVQVVEQDKQLSPTHFFMADIGQRPDQVKSGDYLVVASHRAGDLVLCINTGNIRSKGDLVRLLNTVVMAVSNRDYPPR